MTFGLSDPPATFMNSMNNVFRQYLDIFIIVFIYDILIYLMSKNENINHLGIVFKIFKEQKLFAKLRKCEFLLRSVSFLDHIISSTVIEVDPKNTDVVKTFPTPLTFSDI